MGDFNEHINNTSDPNAKIFIEIMEAFGLSQHVTSFTHKAGNILDHVYTEAGGNIRVSGCSVGDFISDHCIVHTTLEIPKENIVKKTITYRKYALIDHNHLTQDLQFDFDDICDVNLLVGKFEESARKAIDHQAPERTKTVIIRNHNMWFTDEVKQQKSVVRKHERVWRRTKAANDWKSLCTERKKYRNLLKATKKEMLSAKVLECKGDIKRLYRHFKNITGEKLENPMPEGRTDQELADDFANYFIDKIETIRDSLQSIPKFVPSEPVACGLDGFQSLSEEQVQKIIFSLSSKSCELDIIPTHILKDILPGILPVVTRIINLSLEEGVFVNSWKSAIVRPQIKKLGLKLLSSNYRPVSNLSFLSKVLEKAALLQFMAYSDLNCLLPDYQSAYRTNFSCETALVKLMNDLLWSKEQRRIVAKIYISF